MRRPCTTASLLTALVVGLGACGGDDDRPARTPIAASTPSADRYCALTRELDAAGEQVFGELGGDAGPEEYEATERDFVERFDGKLDELERAAPAEIRSDAQTLLAAQRGRAGLGEQVDEKAATAAEKRLRAYEKRHCGG